MLSQNAIKRKRKIKKDNKVLEQRRKNPCFTQKELQPERLLKKNLCIEEKAPFEKSAFGKRF